MPAKPITEVTTSVFALLEPLGTEDRQRVVKAVYALLGEAPLGPEAAKGVTPQDPPADEKFIGSKARQWLLKHQLTREKLESAFYFQDGTVDIHLNTMVGMSKKEQTINCYLMVGAKAFLETDNPQFSDSDAISLCKHTQAYDKNNHTTNRGALGNLVTGARSDGFTLSGPGLKAAAELLLQISSNTSKTNA